VVVVRGDGKGAGADASGGDGSVNPATLAEPVSAGPDAKAGGSGGVAESASAGGSEDGAAGATGIALEDRAGDAFAAGFGCKGGLKAVPSGGGGVAAVEEGEEESEGGAPVEGTGALNKVAGTALARCRRWPPPFT
jgi:hypothetical protein